MGKTDKLLLLITVSMCMGTQRDFQIDAKFVFIQIEIQHFVVILTGLLTSKTVKNV